MTQSNKSEVNSGQDIRIKNRTILIRAQQTKRTNIRANYIVSNFNLKDKKQFYNQRFVQATTKCVQKLRINEKSY